MKAYWPIMILLGLGFTLNTHAEIVTMQCSAKATIETYKTKNSDAKLVKSEVIDLCASPVTLVSEGYGQGPGSVCTAQTAYGPITVGFMHNGFLDAENTETPTIYTAVLRNDTTWQPINGFSVQSDDWVWFEEDGAAQASSEDFFPIPLSTTEKKKMTQIKSLTVLCKARSAVRP